MPYLRAGLVITLNVFIYLLTFGRVLWLEGRVIRGIFRNWLGGHRYRPRRFLRPETEEEIVALIAGEERLRVCGSGHSFNSAIVSDGALVSLDRYRGLLWVDPANKQMAVKGGTRVRELNKLLAEQGLAFAALPSHDAQSIAGIISTDVHGTGRDWGFVSQSVVSLKLITGSGEVIHCEPEDDLFCAAIGGIGAAGIIVEVVVQGVDRFNVRQRVEIRDLAEVEANLDQLIRENDHLSLYVFPFSGRCQVNTWNRTTREQSFLGPQREFATTAIDALLVTWIGNLISFVGLLPRVSRFVLSTRRTTDLVLESYKAFNRTIYPPHQELEAAVPYEDTFALTHRLVELYEEMYPSGLPYTVIELRFTPAGHRRTLIGAGRDRRSTWIDLLTNDMPGYERYFAAAAEILREAGARPHLGKFPLGIDHSYLARAHGDNFNKFQALVREHDPSAKFANLFTRQHFGGAAPATVRHTATSGGEARPRAA